MHTEEKASVVLWLREARAGGGDEGTVFGNMKHDVPVRVCVRYGEGIMYPCTPRCHQDIGCARLSTEKHARLVDSGNRFERGRHRFSPRDK